MLEDISAEKLGALISGIPTPWARAKLFKFAFSTIAAPDPNINTEGLLQFYNMLHAEWKGLMAVIALYPDRIRFSDPVYMDVSHLTKHQEIFQSQPTLFLILAAFLLPSGKCGTFHHKY